MNLLTYYRTKFKNGWDAAAIAHLTPNSEEARFIYDHLLKVGPKQWLSDAGLGDVFGTIKPDTEQDDHQDDHKQEPHDDSNHSSDSSLVAKAFHYIDGKLLTEDNVRLDDELLASLDFPSSSSIDINYT